MGDSQFNESLDPRDNPARNTPRIEYAKGVKGYTQHGGEITLVGGSVYANGAPPQPAPASPLTQTRLSAFDGAENVFMSDSRAMLVHGNVYGLPQSRHRPYTQSQGPSRTSDNSFTQRQGPALSHAHKTGELGRPSDKNPPSPSNGVTTIPPSLTTTLAIESNANGHTGNVPEVPRDTTPYTREVQHLKDHADQHVLSLFRPNSKKDAALYQITQTEILYGYDEVGGIPFSVLAFRLDAGEDEKHLLKVELEGKFVPIFRRTANVKHIWGPALGVEKGPAEATIQVTSTKTKAISGGLSGGKPNIQALLNDQNTKQVEFKAGQEVRAPFKDSEGTFKVTLTLDQHVTKNMSVLKHTSFHILLRLEKKRQPMELELTLTVMYESKSVKLWRPEKIISKSVNVKYSGEEPDDIVKHRSSVTGTRE